MLGVAALMLALTTAQAQTITEDFSLGAQGWTASNGGALSHQASGGNGGGFLQIADSSSDDFLIVAPTALLGNWSSFLGGTLSFDARNINGDSPDWSPFGELTFSGAAGAVSLDMVSPNLPPADGQWHRYSVQLTVANFGAQLPAVLAQLNGLSIKGEYHNGVSEVLGFDNFSVSAVPEPSQALLLSLGLVGLVPWLRRRRDQC
ncbi:PEP-CTERM sorting domain-containing protein [Paucibacter sp. APW11]|uniref:PEP-CTERM sorting domain-containing protein n=1 Tax=Roseateles aquae TaxID=3077235 RepID=A0ABU3PCC7_9BURK|nr:PEP-CTERM sorting domain-containing protein [Paucibacter sp. APW11]MDT9000183.1 PEP-CTERM sorting domain-containing protein [Paucibacter sp. APW11]